ncbi:Asparagine synthetase [glutamine-hydrolyzing] [hydrothermal vent metagenome]|uniref:Asparagine synthetase [glutamine-hydrolyzing] n=1 Tax=hydrothermal vent metagenome TaxID=652676 RepID=A0A3B0Y2E3_9ZZZZ
MCGISGFVNFDGTHLERNQFLRVSDSLSHRGPDGHGCLLGDHKSGSMGLNHGDLGLAHNRLAIIDLSDNALQPMTDADQKLVLVFNGEIYNYKDLRNELSTLGHRFRTTSDTETILYAYKQWGIACLSRLEGMFGFALWDKEKRMMFVARDRLGIKPVYYYSKGQRFAVASELKALLKFPYIDRKINLNAASDFFETRYILAPNSIIQDIYKLEPGNYLEIDSHGVSQNVYWETPGYSESYLDGSEDSLVKNLDKILNNAVEQHLVSDVPVGSFLSGGIDSSLITAIAQKHSDKKIKTFTIGFDDSNYNEAPFASKIADYLGTEHHEHYISESDVLLTVEQLYKHYDEPFGDSSAMPMLCLSRLSSNLFKTVLSGDGGDELFHGYRWFKQIEKSRKFFKIPSAIRKILFNKLSTSIRKYNTLSGLREDKFSRLISQKQSVFPDWKRKALIGNAHGKYGDILDDIFSVTPKSQLELYEKLGILGLKTWLPDEFMVKADRASMAFGLEIRVPILDHKVVEYAMKIDPSLKTKNNSGKHILKEVLGKYVPKDLYEREKKGFSVPLAKWLKTSLNPMMHDTLSRENIERHGIINSSYASKLVDDFENRPNIEAGPLWLLLNFQLWCDEYLA